MSLILDALRKSDHQRARNAAERLRDGPPLAHAPRFPLAAFIVLLAVIALAAAVIAALLVTDRALDDARTDVVNARVVQPAVVRALGTEVASRRVETPARETPTQAAIIGTPAAQTLTADELAAPPFASLPAELRARLPALHVDVHAWAEDPQARFVLINLKRYHEGDRLDEGPMLRHILRDGVVLEFEGALFSLSRAEHHFTR